MKTLLLTLVFITTALAHSVQELRIQTFAFAATYANPEEVKSASFRVDHTVNDTSTIFARFATTPFSSKSRGNGFTTANMVSHQENRNFTRTGGWQWQRSPKASNDLRVNWTRSSLNNSCSLGLS
jgi:hypothetical protein